MNSTVRIDKKKKKKIKKKTKKKKQFINKINFNWHCTKHFSFAENFA